MTTTFDTRARFYLDVLSRTIPDRAASVLVVGGGTLDARVFRELGFTNVVISNLDTRTAADEFAPYAWSYQDAESLTFEAGSFDNVVVHAALHHCHSPHRALVEMYRVARRGVLAFESRDSAVLRTMERLGMVQTYEHAAVVGNDGKFGGVNNTDVPNFVYRWTEREVEKTVNSYAPHVAHRFEYFYGHALPATAHLERGGGLRRAAIRVLAPGYRLFAKAFPRQQNLFAFTVSKPVPPAGVHPWLAWDGERVRFNAEWARERYR